MAERTGQYDPELHMFRERPKNLDPNRLRYLRWLVVEGVLGDREIYPQTAEAVESVLGNIPQPVDRLANRSY